MHPLLVNSYQIFVHTRSQKRYGLANYQYFKNGNTQQYNIFRRNTYNFYLVVCEACQRHLKL